MKIPYRNPVDMLCLSAVGWGRTPEIPAGHMKLSVLKLSVLGSGRKKLSILVIFHQNISFLAKNALSTF